MRLALTLRDKDQIVVGKPLPFSVFSAEGNLLLAAGRVVESDHARQVLLSNGARRGSGGCKPGWFNGDSEAEAQLPGVSPLVAFQNSYRRTQSSDGLLLSMARNETSEAFRTRVVGAHDRILLVDAPARSDGALVVVIPGQTWLCRTFQTTSAFRFRGTVLKVGFEPFPQVYMDVSPAVEASKVRNRSRASVLVRATLELPISTQGLHGPTSCIVTDLSAGGGRIATANDLLLERDQQLRIVLKLPMMDAQFELALQAVIVRLFGSTERNHPNVIFYGIRFESLTERDSLILHGFVNSQLALGLNCLWQLLSAPAR